MKERDIVCVCVCVCERERDRERKKSNFKLQLFKNQTVVGLFTQLLSNDT
jgi:hypothetical protein